MEPVATGSKRLCFVHPHDPDLMVKVARPDASPEILRQNATSLRRRLLPARYMDQQLRELRAYQRLQRQHGKATWQHIPEFMHMVETDLGVGLVTRFIRNADGSAAVNLTRFMREDYDDDVEASVLALMDFVVDLRLMPRDFKPYNVVISRNIEGRAHAWLVDGFGSAEFLPVSDWSRWHGTRMAQRRVDHFLANLRHRLANPDKQYVYPLTRDG